VQDKVRFSIRDEEGELVRELDADLGKSAEVLLKNAEPCDDLRGGPKELYLEITRRPANENDAPDLIAGQVKITRPRSTRDRAVVNPRLPKGKGKLEIAYIKRSLDQAPHYQWAICRMDWKPPATPKRQRTGEKATESNKKRKARNVYFCFFFIVFCLRLRRWRLLLPQCEHCAACV
jgi:hypothetical protein